MFESDKPITTKRRWFRRFLILLLVLSVLAFLFTHGLRYGATRWLAGHGADSVRIGWLHLNPLTGFITIEDLLVRKGGETVLWERDIDLDVSIRDLFRRKLTIEKARLDGVRFDIRQYEDGSLRLAAFLLGREAGEADTVEVGEASGRPWIFNLNDLELRNFLVSFTSPTDTYTLRAENLNVHHLSTARSYGKRASLSFSGSLNGAPLHLEIRNSRLLSMPAVSGRIDVNGLDLAGFNGVAGAVLDKLAGSFSAEGMFAVNSGGDNLLDVVYDGELSLRTADIRRGGDALSADELIWQGHLDYDSLEKNSFLRLDGGLHGSGLEVSADRPGLAVKQDNITFTTASTLQFSDRTLSVDGNSTLEIIGTECRLGEGRHWRFGRIDWQGDNVYQGGGKQQVSLTGVLQGEDCLMTLAGQGLKLGLDFLRLDTGVSLNGQEENFMVGGGSDLQVAGASLNLAGNRDLHIDGLVWQGDMDYRLGERQQGSLSGSLTGKGFAMDFPGQQLVLDLSSLELDTDTSLNTETGDFKIEGTNDLRVSGADLKLADRGKFKTASLTWQGETVYRGFAESDVSLDGTLESGDFAMELEEPVLGLHLADCLLQTEISLQAGKDGFNITGDNDLTVSGADLELGEARQLTGRVKRLHLAGGRLESLDRITAGLLNVADLTVNLKGAGIDSAENEPFLSFAEGEVEGVSFLQSKLVSVEQVDLRDFSGRFRREQDGGFSGARVLGSLGGAEEKAEDRQKKPAAAVSPSRAMDVRLGKFEIGGQSRLYFDDYSLSQPFQTVLDIKDFEVAHLDSTKPAEPFSFLVRGTLGQYSVLAVNGTSTPFAENFGLTLHTGLDDYPASNLSPYAVDLIGYYLSQGHVNIDSDLRIHDNTLESENRFLFKKLEVKVASEEAAEKMTTMLHNISLDQSLSLLRDGKDHINLDLPVSGPLDDLQVGFDDIAKKVVSKAVIKGAKTYFLNTLGPYGTLVSVGLKVGGHLLKVRLPPVVFEPGESALQFDQEEYLQKLAEILYERPELEVTISGVAALSERELLPAEESAENVEAGKEESQDEEGEVPEKPLSLEERKALLKEADRRSAAVRDHMIEKYNINPGRVFVAESILDEGEEAKPRVEMGF